MVSSIHLASCVISLHCAQATSITVESVLSAAVDGFLDCVVDNSIGAWVHETPRASPSRPLNECITDSSLLSRVKLVGHYP